MFLHRSQRPGTLCAFGGRVLAPMVRELNVCRPGRPPVLLGAEARTDRHVAVQSMNGAHSTTGARPPTCRLRMEHAGRGGRTSQICDRLGRSASDELGARGVRRTFPAVGKLLSSPA